MLNAGLPVDSRDLLGWTALMRAAENNHTDIVHFFLQKGASVNGRTDAGTKALHFASRGNLFEKNCILLKTVNFICTQNILTFICMRV